VAQETRPIVAAAERARADCDAESARDSRLATRGKGVPGYNARGGVGEMSDDDH